MTVKWKITAEHKDKKYTWFITSIEDKSILWQNIKKKLHKGCSWLKAYKEIKISTRFERFDKKCQIPCFKRG